MPGQRAFLAALDEQFADESIEEPIGEVPEIAYVGPKAPRQEDMSEGVAVGEVDRLGEIGRASCRERVWIPV